MAGLPNDGEINFLEMVVAAGSAIGGALTAAIGLVWRRAGREARMIGEIKALRDRLDEADKRLDAFEREQNQRHEAHIRAIAALPDKADFRHFQNEVNQRLAELKDIVMRVAR
jgi:hypothetical protein